MSDSLHIELDVKNYIDLLAERGMDVGELRARHDRLAADLEEPDRGRSADWLALERDVIAADEALVDPDEPSELEEILAARPSDRVDAYPDRPSPAEVADRTAAAWLGRVAGCILGKPVECLMREPDSRAKLKQLLGDSGDWPLDDYVRGATMEPYYAGGGPKWFHGSNPSLRENLRYAPADDDLNYTVLSLAVLDQWGLDFSPECVLEKWLALLPFRAVCTAEKLAYRNRILGMDYPEVARYRNPYKEWIGAQIRTDAYGYVLPGRPADAARLGWQDAAASHVANGIYGAMWVSAALAAAVVERDPETVIRRGLEQVPAGSRFTRHVLRTIDVARANGDDYEKTFDDIAARLGSYHCVHTINNACVVVAALLHGAGEFGRTICVAVMGGLDTDCNGATAGSIAGAMLGPEAIDAKWSAPLNDTLHTALVNHAEVRISELARRTTELAERLA